MRILQKGTVAELCVAWGAEIRMNRSTKGPCLVSHEGTVPTPRVVVTNVRQILETRRAEFTGAAITKCRDSHHLWLSS